MTTSDTRGHLYFIFLIIITIVYYAACIIEA